MWHSSRWRDEWLNSNGTGVSVHTNDSNCETAVGTGVSVHANEVHQWKGIDPETYRIYLSRKQIKLWITETPKQIKR